MMDPDFYEEEAYFSDYDDDDGAEEYVYDTFDRIIDDVELDPEMQEPDGQPDEVTIGMAFALADAIRDVERKHYDVDEETDDENMQEVMKLQARHEVNNNLRPFEQYIEDICKGRRPLFED